MAKKLLTKVGRGLAFGDVSNASVRNILTEISRELRGSFNDDDMRFTLDFFDWKCPYTGKDLRALIENDLGGYATDHIYPQNKEWCGLNVRGNLAFVDKVANSKKGSQDVETFLLTNTEFLTDFDARGWTRQQRLDKIKEFQKQCGYDPMQIRDIVRPLMEKRYEQIRDEQEQWIRDTMDALKTVNVCPLPGIAKLARVKNTGAGSSKAANAYTYDEKVDIVAQYLRGDDGLVQLEKNKMQLYDKKGWVAKAILNELGVDTSRKSSHKGLLKTVSLDDAIAQADGTFKITLQEIKKRHP